MREPRRRTAQRLLTHTVTCQVFVDLFDVTFNIQNASGTPEALLKLPNLRVMELTPPIPDFEVLIGLDVLRQCLLILNGSHDQFTLSD
jgi:hypothetical protein